MGNKCIKCSSDIVSKTLPVGRAICRGCTESASCDDVTVTYIGE